MNLIRVPLCRENSSMTRHLLVVLLLVTNLSARADSAVDQVEPAEPVEPTVRLMRLPKGGIQPQAMVDSVGVARIVYFRGDPQAGDVYYVRLVPEADSFTTPVRVNSEPGSAVAVGTVRGAQLAIGTNNRIHIAWNGSRQATPRAPGDQTPLLYTRSTKDGDGFEPQRNIIQSQTGLDGGSSIAADQEGHVYVVWHAPADDRKEEQYRRVWLARSDDDGATFTHEASVAPVARGACGCCGLKAFAGTDSSVFILYRSAWQIEHRNMYLLASNDNGTRFRELTSHPWRIGQCVMSSASFATAGNDVLGAWESKEQVYFTRIEGKDIAATPSPAPIPAPGTGDNRKHPVLASNGDGKTILVWTEGTAWQRGGDVVWQIFDADGDPMPEQRGRAQDLPVWGLAAVVSGTDGVFTIIY
jgi:hypothetical protein